MERQAAVEANNFENEIKSKISKGLVEDDSLTFYQFASSRWLEKIKHEASVNYYQKAKNTIEFVKLHLNYKLIDITPNIIQTFYNYLDSRKKKVITIKPKANIREVLSCYGYNYHNLRYELGIQNSTLCTALKGDNVSEKWANRLADKTNINFEELFDKQEKYVPYAYETTHQIKRTIRAILAYAKKQRLIENNYASAEYIDFPRRPRHSIETLTDEEAYKLYDYLLSCDNLKLVTPALVALLCGLRRGEIAGLKWSDINFQKKIIDIKRALITADGAGVIETTPKTNDSYRAISIPDILVEHLIKYKRWQDSEKERLGDFYHDNDWVFAQVDGNRINPHTFTGNMTDITSAAGVKHCTLHSLRHTNITLLLMSGVSLNVASARAGHARTSTTTDIYGYVLDRSERQAANTVVDYLNQISKSNECDTSSDDDVNEYRKAKAEMKRLGFDSYEEYLDYLEFLKMKNKKASI